MSITDANATDSRDAMKDARLISLVQPQGAWSKVILSFFPKAHIEQMVRAAGYQGLVKPEAVMFTILTAAVTGVIGSLFVIYELGLSGITNKVILGFFVIIGFAPYSKLSEMAKARTRRITRGLPETLNLIIICVESGMPVDDALAKVASKRPGEPTTMEFQRALLAMRSGTPKPAALQQMAANTASPPLEAVASAMAASVQDGGQLIDALRSQAKLQRSLRQSEAEKWAKKIPIKLLAPLVLCIFPSLFVPMLGPAGISIYDALIANG